MLLLFSPLLPVFRIFAPIPFSSSNTVLTEIVDRNSLPLAAHITRVIRVRLLSSVPQPHSRLLSSLLAVPRESSDTEAEGDADDAGPETATCTLRLTVLNLSSSEGRVFKLVGLQVGEERGGPTTRRRRALR